MDCVCSLEQTHSGVSYESPLSMLKSRNKADNVYPFKPQLLSGHLLGNSCSLGLPYILVVVTLSICDLSYFPFWF